MVDPHSLNYRSPVLRNLQAMDAEFTEVNGYAVATSVHDAAEEASALRRLALCDLSGLPRTGVKGPGVGQWLSDQGFSVPSEPNRSMRQDDGSLLAMLADNEALILGDVSLASRSVDRLTTIVHEAASTEGSPPGFLVPRQHSHAWFRISGHEMAATFAKICAVDLRTVSFADLQVAQTSVARLSAIVIRDDLADLPAAHLLADSASAVYLWECLQDAGAEHEMHVIGLDTLRESTRGK